MRDKAREVFVALISSNKTNTVLANFEEVFSNDFSSWRFFFRALKDLTADPDSALAELAGGGFLAGGASRRRLQNLKPLTRTPKP